MSAHLSSSDFATPALAERMQQRALVVGGVAAVLAVIGLLVNPAQFFRSFLLGYSFWIGVSLGSLAILMLQYLAGGLWGFIIRRVLEAAAQVTVPAMALLFLVFAFGMDDLYLWARPDEVAKDPALQHKVEFWLNLPAFWARAVFYFAIWGLLAAFLTRWSRQNDERADLGLRRRLQGVSGPGLVLYGFTVTFASVDWLMSLDPHWFSTIFGVLVMGGQALSAMAFAIAMVVLLSAYEPLSLVVRREQIHDLGKLLLAFVMLWAYFSFSQLLIIWSGNLPEEIPWYLHRWQHGWQYIGLALVVFHFALPFLLLLSRDLKVHRRRLAVVAVGILVMRLVDLYWTIAPSFPEARQGFVLHWLDFVLPVAIGGLWLAAFFRYLRSCPLVALNDPLLDELLEKEHAGA